MELLHMTEKTGKSLVFEVPAHPFQFVHYFRRVVGRHFPDASFPDKITGKELGQARYLLRLFSRSDLYELVELVVVDWSEIASSRIFLKAMRENHPTLSHLVSNRSVLRTLVGKGFGWARPGGSESYLRSYRQRHP